MIRTNKLLCMLLGIFLFCSLTASAYNWPINETITLTVEENTTTVGFEGSTWSFINSELVTHTITKSFNVSVLDCNCTNISSLDEDTLFNLLYDFSNGIKNNVSSDMFSGLMPAIMLNMSQNREDIVERVRTTFSSVCDMEGLKNNISGLLVSSILPDKAAYDSLKDQVANLNLQQTQCSINKAQVDKDLLDSQKDGKNKNYIIYALVAILLVAAYLQWGGQGPRFIEKMKWRRGETQPLPPSNYRSQKPQMNPRINPGTGDDVVDKLAREIGENL